MTVRSNPRILVIFTVIPVVVLAGIGMLFVLGILYGLFALGAAFLISWSLLKITRRQLATQIETLEDEVVFELRGDEKLPFRWEKVRIAGFARMHTPPRRQRGSGRTLFVYNEQDDRLITVSDEFENLDGLAVELSEKTDFREIVLSRGETLRGKLREIVGYP
jgi:hypothetical protein